MGTSSQNEDTKVTHFLDAAASNTVSLEPSRDAMRQSSVHPNADGLGAFLERPIQIGSVAWTPGQVGPLTLITDPWTLFLENKRVANRMNNFFLLGGNMHVKYMINGNSFYYGRAMVDYLPLPNYDNVTDASTLPTVNLVNASQRMHIYLDPTNSQGGELVIPMLWPYDRIGLINTDYNQLGACYLRELTGLKHANGSVTPVEITVFAWMTDVELSIPTTFNLPNLVPQSAEKPITKGSEYGKPIVSSILSAVAAASSKLMSFPAFAPYAMATSMVSSSLGAMAKSFGYSRPAALVDVKPVRPTFFGEMATTDMMDDVKKLTVTSKQELSIDPRIGGANAHDELVVADIAARESWLTSFPWTVARVQNDCLFSIRVTPDNVAFSGGVYYLPACCFAAAPFYYWKGTMRIRLSVVASAHHKGRLRAIYDPYYVQNVEANIAFNKIIDLEHEREVVIDIPWSQKQQFCIHRSTGNWFNFQNSAITTGITGATNGVLGLYVLNTLTTPNSTVNNDIAVNVFVSFEDFEVAVPDSTLTSTFVNTYSYTPQSQEHELASTQDVPAIAEDCTTCMVEEDPTPDKYKVYFGERITSFRQLLKRYVLHSIIDTTSTAAGRGRVAVTNQDFPQYRGYSSANMNTTATAGKFNYVAPTLLHWLTPAYLAVKGGMRVKYHLVANTTTTSPITMAVSRRRPGAGYSVALSTVDITTPSKLAASIGTSGYMSTNYDGTAVTDPRLQPVLEVELPYYKNVRFDCAKTVDGSFLDPVKPGWHFHVLELSTAGTSQSQVERFVSVAEDFQLMYFQGCPPLRALSNPAA